jgi:NAD(P)-dependent dehydrogenase (short-subunit alcohol dehydrogenase family)
MTPSSLKTPYNLYHNTTYPSIDPTQPGLSTISKSAIVTGAGSGIGAAVALSLARSGISRLALLGRRQHALEKTKSTIEAAVGTASTAVSIYAVDMTEPVALNAALVSFAQQCAGGNVDILVANAGSLGALATIRDADPAAWWDGFQVNVMGNFHLVRSFLSIAARNAAVIYLSSAVVHGPHMPNESSYCASKTGATKLFECLHHEHPELFVLSVHPGLLAGTDMMEGFENIARGLQVEMAELPWDERE